MSLIYFFYLVSHIVLTYFKSAIEQVTNSKESNAI